MLKITKIFYVVNGNSHAESEDVDILIPEKEANDLKLKMLDEIHQAGKTDVIEIDFEHQNLKK